MSAVLKHWPLIFASAAAIYFYGGLVNRVESLETNKSLIMQMSIDIAVIKQAVEWLKAEKLESNRDENLDRRK